MKAAASTIFATLALGLGVLALSSAQTAPPKLAGITAKDPFPNGCVSCHVKMPDQDVRLNLIQKTVKKHPSIASVKTVPTDCMKCHKAGTKTAMSVGIHKMHYSKGEKSLFVQKFGGECLNCHTLDPKTFKMSVKSGAKNW